MAEPGINIVRSVTLLYERLDESPLHHTSEPFGLPRRTDVPTPHSAFVKEWSRKQDLVYGRPTTEWTVADLFVFENAKLGKKLEVFVWPVKQRVYSMICLHYAFLLQVVEL